MRQRKENKLTKEFLRTVIVGGFYAFRLCRVTDAAHQVYYVGERINRGGTVIGDTEQDVIRQLEAQATIIDNFLAKTR